MKTLLVSINAKNLHKSLAPFCLASAAKHRLDYDVDIFESNVNVPFVDMLTDILSYDAQCIGFCCYIWNIEFVLKLCRCIKTHNSDIFVILGGPEVTAKEHYDNADIVVSGNGEDAFCNIISKLHNGDTVESRIEGQCDFATMSSPLTDKYFQSFDNDDITNIGNRLVYYESSRGCPFKCSYCMSSIEDGVQYLPLDKVKSDLLLLVAEGAKIIKFVDRTFNANKRRAYQILEFIKNMTCQATFHMEVGADLFDSVLIELISGMPVGRVQFEIGIQSINETTLRQIDRATDLRLALDNIYRLTSLGNCHVYVDLIAGLPYETFDSFCCAIERVLQCQPYSLHIGFLKLLKGTKIRAQADTFCRYLPFAPYEVLYTDLIDMRQMRTLKAYESIVDKFYNSNLFANTIRLAIGIFGGHVNFIHQISVFHPHKTYKISNKNAFALLYDLLSQYTDSFLVEHCIKLDVLSCDPKGILPSSIVSNRQKDIEREYKSQFSHLRVEYFAHDGTTRLFDYNDFNAISNTFACHILDSTNNLH